MAEDAKSELETQDIVLITVTARIPEFWTDQPALWFIQFEAAVAPQKASDTAKYQLLIAKLGKQVIQQISKILESPPETGKYEVVKERLLHIYEESETNRLQKLIGDMQLGEQKPSQLWRRMTTLAGSRMAKETLLVLWQNHLPVAVRTVLAATSLTDAEKLAEVANKVMETSRPLEVAAVTPSSNSSSLADAVAKLSLEVPEIRKWRHREKSTLFYCMY
ncbi:uncharacterized protein LOC126370434 [Pectinophora gossypiella]|uniref:uncharacterized protein LOC126370434 n=1 Tax=Pectinophora gossypiella TaxID=13191 RepID=UPI00214E92C4|nr:uncharacterized protein LOC126370434 [Pectinophora gossypiella]